MITQTLAALKSGELLGAKSLKLAEGLKEFPEEIFALSNTLEVLDLSDNQLTKLPARIVELQHLKILFIARNKFTVFPSVLSKLPVLSMIGFKSNQIEIVPENVFPAALRWLILTDNQIEQLPKSIGDCILLQKCGLSGNKIKQLPLAMANCVNLELLRIAANQLISIPSWLFKLPKLSWVAFGGNPATPPHQPTRNLPLFPWQDFTVKELLGAGASGFISKAHWISKEKAVAIKVFKGKVTTDGLPEDEMKIAIAAGGHKNLIPILGEIIEHPENKSGLIMELISPSYINLGNPPSLETCTRDIFDKTNDYNKFKVLKIAKSMASVCLQLHRQGINHGDFYAHNILVNESGECLLGDFGAASFYDVHSTVGSNIERIEVRAFGCLLEDILGLVKEKELPHDFYKKWQKLIDDCIHPVVEDRPSFSNVLEMLNDF